MQLFHDFFVVVIVDIMYFTDRIKRCKARPWRPRRCCSSRCHTCCCPAVLRDPSRHCSQIVGTMKHRTKTTSPERPSAPVVPVPGVVVPLPGAWAGGLVPRVEEGITGKDNRIGH